MNDSGNGWHYPEIIEGTLSPPQKLVTLLVALEFEFSIDGEGSGRTKRVDLHRMVDHQICWLQGIDPGGIAAKLANGVAHRGEVGYYRHAGKVLEQHARRHKGNLLAATASLGGPSRQCLNLRAGNNHAILAPEQVLQHHLYREGHPRQVKTGICQRLQRV